MKSKHLVSSSQWGLGDCALLTNIVSKFPGQFCVQIPPEYSRFSILFHGLAEVQITPKEKCLPLNDYGDGHFVRRKLRGIIGGQAEHTDIHPVILYEDPDSNYWASEYLKDKPNPVIICPFVSQKWAHVRNLPPQVLQEIFAAIKINNQTPIIVQSDTDKQWDCAVLNDLELPKLICLLRKVGYLYTANTGLYHVAAGVGAKIIEYHPSNSPFFDASEWCYFGHPTITHKTW